MKIVLGLCESNMPLVMRAVCEHHECITSLASTTLSVLEANEVVLKFPEEQQRCCSLIFYQNKSYIHMS